MKKEMLINVLQPEECRIAILEDGVLEELYVERTSHEAYTGNIYLGKIVNLEPAIQAAFVDFSVGRNGFLHVSDVEPQYYGRLLEDESELPTRDRGREPRRDREAEPRSRDREAEPRARDREAEPRARDREAEPRPRDRDREPAPERGRDRERIEPRPAPPARGEERPSSFGRGLVPEDEPESRPREPRERGRTEERPAREFGWDIDWDRPDRSEKPERPDRSEKGRRRRFGEGLTDDIEPEPEPTPEPESMPEPEPARWGRAEAPRTEPEAPGEIESFLPPSRTERGGRRPVEPIDEPEAPAPESSRARPSGFGAGLVEPGPSEPEAEPEASAPAGRERRRGRGRGRAARQPSDLPPPAPPEPEPELRREPTPPTARSVPEPEPEPFEEPGVSEPDESDRPDPEAPRRRGRDAIRARGGDRPAGRPRDRDREPAVERPVRPPADDWDDLDTRAREPEPEPEFGREPERPAARGRGRTRDRDRDREAEPRRDREPAAEREPARDRDRGTERVAPHARAGEPGYVPRRERVRSPEPGSEVGWSDEPPRRPIDEDIARLLVPEADLDTGAADDDDAERLDESGGRRRRRRRRRRRGDRDETTAEGATSPESEIDSEVDDLDLEEEEPRPARRPRPTAPRALSDAPPARARRPRDEDDLDDEDDEDEDDEELLDDGPSVRVVDEEIEPELEEEIRREIEEIQELEREMGLRGTTEARPRRGDRDRDDTPAERGGKEARPRSAIKPPIQEIFRRGDPALVQVIKESIGTKGPTLSTYISIPGRYLVLMPGLNRVGVSRKIADEGQRRRLREIMHALNPPKGLGFIVRTAGLDRTKRELAKDLAYLLRLWKVILRRIKKAKAPAAIYQESDMIIRTIRDIFTPEIDTIWIDEPHAFERAQEFLRVVMPKYVHKIKFYDERVPLFHKYGLEDEIARIQRRRVDLPGGGSIVIDPTEALVAIDVNSGNFRVEDDAERTAYEMNLRAAREIARQLRLRDLGGVIVCDFIDMRDEKHRRGVERAVRDAMKRDRARTKILRMSQFGLIQMTRQRIRPSLKRSVYEDCTNCAGAGVVKTAESMAIDVMRLLALAAHRAEVRRVNLTVAPSVATYLNNRKRSEITRIEDEADLTVHIRHEEGVSAEHLQVDCFDAQNAEVRLLPAPPPPRRGR